MTSPTKYTFVRDGVPENVAREPWRWRVAYEDGSLFEQFDDETGVFHQFAEIEQSRAVTWALVHDELSPIIMTINPGDKLVHFYRNVTLDYMGENNKHRLYCFGVERDSGKVMVMAMPDNQIIVTDDVDKVVFE